MWQSPRPDYSGRTWTSNTVEIHTQTVEEQMLTELRRIADALEKLVGDGTED